MKETTREAPLGAFFFVTITVIISEINRCSNYMNTFLENKFVRFGIFGVGAIVALAVLLTILSSVFGFSASQYRMSTNMMGYDAPGIGGGMMDGVVVSEVAGVPSMGRALVDEYDMTSSYYPGPLPPVPAPDGYTANLESYETTSYSVTARSNQFDTLCDALNNLKADNSIHFKSLNVSLNNCNAQFFVEEGKVDAVLAQFTSYGDVTIDRTTASVTRHKEQIESQASIVRAQLETVEATLTEAQTAYDEIIALARSERDAAALNRAIQNKLQQIDSLSNRKIALTSQLDSYAQQAADLEERLGVVEFYANFNRLTPTQVGQHEQQWSQAWKQLGNQFTMTLIGLTVTFGIFLLYIVQYGVYLLVLLVVARFGWKLLQRIWKL